MTFHVRPVEAADAEAWAVMRHALWPQLTVAEHAAEIAAFLRGAATEPQAVLVAVPAGDRRAAGFAELSLRAYAEGCDTSPVGYLEGWYVEPRWRGRNVGRALMEASEAWARSVGCRELASDTEADNRSSAAAHLALGFQAVGVIQCFRKALQPGEGGPR